jgi:hypothetical protein
MLRDVRLHPRELDLDGEKYRRLLSEGLIWNCRRSDVRLIWCAFHAAWIGAEFSTLEPTDATGTRPLLLSTSAMG